MRLDVGEACEEIRAGEIADRNRTYRLSLVEGGYTSDEVVLAARFPDFHAGWQSLHRLAYDADAFADLRGAIFGLIVADDTSANYIAVFVENPERVESGPESVLQNFFGGLGAIGLHLAREIAQAGQRTAPEIVHQRLGLFRSDFEWAREPAAESAVQQRIADEKHEDDRKERERHRADDHFCFEARAELVFAAFSPEAKDSAREDETEDEKCRSDEAGDGVKPHDGAPVARFEGNIERTECENGGDKKSDGDAADDERPALAWAEAHAGTEVEDGCAVTVPLWARGEFLRTRDSQHSRNENERTGARLGSAAGCGWDATGVSFAQYRGLMGKSRRRRLDADGVPPPCFSEECASRGG